MTGGGTREPARESTDCLSPDDIDSFIRGECDSVPEGRAERHVASCSACRELVSALVKLDAVTTSSVLSRRPPAAASDPADLELGAGSRIGRYVLLDHLGDGAMGVVYSAHDAELGRKVALKLLRSDFGPAQGSLRERLRREAQVMAKIAHPNVATVFDVETWGDRIFMTMEMVEGETLEGWLGAPRPWRAVMEKFLAAGHGLAAAHDAGIIHRDFKPANVLIGADGRVRVADFGLALLAGNSAANAAGEKPNRPTSGARRPTSGPRPGLLAYSFTGTPFYMAPEQLVGKVADARSDQFSFCVSLHVALTGRHPFAGGAAGETFEPAELLANLRSGRMNQALAQTRLPRSCRQALLRGLRPVPGERFPDMRALLAGLSVHSTAKTRGMAVAVAVALFVGGGAVYAMLFGQGGADRLPRCDLGRARLAGVWDHARRDRARAAFRASGLADADRTWSAFAANLDRRATSWVEMYDDACAATLFRGVQSAEVLDLRVECLDRKLQEMKALVDIYSEKLDRRALDRASEASESLSAVRGCADTVNLRAVVPLPDDPAARATMRSLRERLSRSHALFDAGRFEEGRALAAALKRDADRLGHAPLAAEVASSLGQHLIRLARSEEAEEVLLEAAEKAVLGRAAIVEAEASIALVRNYLERGRAKEGLVAARSAELAVLRAGNDELLRIRLTQNRAGIEFMAGNLEKALDDHRRAAELAEAFLGPRSALFFQNLSNIGNDLAVLGRNRESLVYLERALEIAGSVLRPGHPNIAYTHTSLGVAYGKLGMHRRSVAAHRAALETRRTELGLENPNTVWAMVNLGMAEGNLGNYDVALDLFAQAEKLQHGIDPDNVFLSSAYLTRGEIQLRAGRHAEAALAFKRAIEHTRRVGDPEGLNVGYGLVDLGLLANRRGRHREAVRQCRQGLAILMQGFKADSSELGVAHECIGEGLIGVGRLREARAQLERASALVSEADAAPRDVAALRFQLARALWSSPSDRPRAHRLARAALTALRSAEGDQRDLIARAEAWLRAHPEPRARPPHGSASRSALGRVGRPPDHRRAR